MSVHVSKVRLNPVKDVIEVNKEVLSLYKSKSYRTDTVLNKSNVEVFMANINVLLVKVGYVIMWPKCYMYSVCLTFSRQCMMRQKSVLQKSRSGISHPDRQTR